MKDRSSLKQLHQNLLTRGALFASYRLPEAKDTFTIVQLSSSLKPVESNLVNNESGFLINPFDNKIDKPVWIQPEVIFKDGDYLSGNERWQEYELVNQPAKFSNPTPISQHDYNIKIQNLKRDIELHGLKKAVFTRVIKTHLKNLNGADLFEALSETYPKAFIFLVNLPDGTTWIGASPETLLTINGNNLETMALAGTRKKTDHDTLWREKEVEEQKFVEQHIEEVLIKYEINFEKTGPHTFDTGSNIEHLRTLYFSNQFKHNTWGLLNNLHPTPAVCGLPVELSKKWLDENEGYNRSYYSGFLGPVNMNESSNYFVNLRCAQIIGNEANIYVGGGITESSDSQHEWTETELKSRTVLDIIESKLKI